MAKRKPVRIQMIHSPHDGGFYCEVYDPETGAELYSTRVYPTEREAKRAALNPDAYRVPPLHPSMLKRS
jgi:hypothetical protein